jgi:hypothetical protein
MARVPAEVNRLSNQVLVTTYEREWGKVHAVIAGAAAAGRRGRAGGLRAGAPEVTGGFAAPSVERGHLLRERRAGPSPSRAAPTW